MQANREGVIKKIVFIIYFVLLIIITVGLSYYLPAKEKVFLVGTEVKREMRKSRDGEKQKDVRYVVAREIPSGDTLMFRNEDIAWPPYMKFDSGDLSGKVMNLEEFRPDAVILVTYYGFRIPLLSLYPNITKVAEAKDLDSTVSILSWLVFIIFLVGAILGYIFLKRKLE